MRRANRYSDLSPLCCPLPPLFDPVGVYGVTANDSDDKIRIRVNSLFEPKNAQFTTTATIIINAIFLGVYTFGKA